MVTIIISEPGESVKAHLTDSLLSGIYAEQKRIDHIDKSYKEIWKMSYNKIVVPEAKAALEQFKMEAASEVGVNLKQGYNGELTSKQAGSIGGQMVKKMIEKYENDIKSSK